MYLPTIRYCVHCRALPGRRGHSGSKTSSGSTKTAWSVFKCELLFLLLLRLCLKMMLMPSFSVVDGGEHRPSPR